MSRAYKSPLRPLAVAVAVLMAVFSLGMAGTATAESSTDNANANASANANGQANAYGQVTDPSAGAPSTGSDMSDTKSDAKGSADQGGSTDQGAASTASDHQTQGTAGTSGTPPASQPISGADDNTGGANGQCPGGVYCGTVRDKPSMNGNGTGAATGKPCAGCVGKADNKNPKGQMPGPQDRNNGYECDGNNGIAKGNPAHTGCTTTVTPPTTTSGPCVPKPGEIIDANGNCVKKNDTPPVVAPEEELPGSNRPPTVAGVEQFAGPQPPAGVEQFAGPSTAVGPSGVLPSTGATTMLNALAATGLGLLLLGAAMLVLRRKAHQA